MKRLTISNRVVYEAFSRYAKFGCMVSMSLPKDRFEKGDLLIAVEEVEFDKFKEASKELGINLDFTPENTLLVKCDKYGLISTEERVSLNAEMLERYFNEGLPEGYDLGAIQASFSNSTKAMILNDLRVCGLEKYAVGTQSDDVEAKHYFRSGRFSLFTIKATKDSLSENLGCALVSDELNEDGTRDLDLAIYHPLAISVVLDELGGNLNYIGSNPYIPLLLKKGSIKYAKKDNI